MGNPILRPDPDPLPLWKGYFVAHPTANLVGSYPPDAFVPHQRQTAAAAFVPLVSIAGGLLRPAWAGQRLSWVFGGLDEDGVFFRVHGGGQLEYLGTSRHPSPDWVDFQSSSTEQRPVSPGFVDFVAQEGEDNSADEEDEDGYLDAPAVFVGGAPPLPASDCPGCLRCRGAMVYCGSCGSGVFSDDLAETVVHLFYCEECRVQCCLDRPD